jgi:hypothetical protein
MDLDPHALPCLEARELKPPARELDPRIKRWLGVGSRIDAPVSPRLLDGDVPLGVSGQCITHKSGILRTNSLCLSDSY